MKSLKVLALIAVFVIWPVSLASPQGPPGVGPDPMLISFQHECHCKVKGKDYKLYQICSPAPLASEVANRKCEAEVSGWNQCSCYCANLEHTCGPIRVPGKPERGHM